MPRLFVYIHLVSNQSVNHFSKLEMNRSKQTKRKDDPCDPEKKPIAALERYKDYLTNNVHSTINEILDKLERDLPKGVTMVRESESKIPGVVVGFYTLMIQICKLRKGDFDIIVHFNICDVGNDTVTIGFLDIEGFQAQSSAERAEAGKMFRLYRGVDRYPDVLYMQALITEMFSRMSERIKPPIGCAKSARSSI